MGKRKEKPGTVIRGRIESVRVRDSGSYKYCTFSIESIKDDFDYIGDEYDLLASYNMVRTFKNDGGKWRLIDREVENG